MALVVDLVQEKLIEFSNSGESSLALPFTNPSVNLSGHVFWIKTKVLVQLLLWSRVTLDVS